MLAGVACAALMALTLPAEAATIPQLPGTVSADTGDAAVAILDATRRTVLLSIEDRALA